MNMQIVKRGLYNCFLNVWFFMNPDAKERYQKHLFQMELRRIRSKAENNYLQYIEESGKAKRIGDRMLVSLSVLETTNERFLLENTLLDIEVDDTSALTNKDILNMVQQNTDNKVTNRRMEVFQYTDTMADEVNPWSSYHRV